MAQEPPPRHVSEFDHIWRDWLYFWWESINEYPAGGRGFGGLGVWRYQTDTGSTPPTGELQFDNLDIDSATNLYINETNDTGTDMSAFLDLVTIGDLIYIQAQDEATQFVTVQVGTPSVSAGVYTFPLTTSEAQGAQLADNQEVSVVITKGAIGIGGGDHGALVGLVPDDDHTQYLNKDITRHLTVGYTTDVEADTFTDPLVPDFSLEYFKTTTVTSDFTLNTPTGNSHGEYYLTIDSGGPYTLTAGTNVTLMDSNVTMLADENYILNIHRYSATNTVAQLLPIPIVITDITAIHDNVAAEISAIADKATPVAADHLIIEDSADSDAKKDITIGSMATALEGVIDHYNLINGGTVVSPATGDNWNAHGNTALGASGSPLKVENASFYIEGTAPETPVGDLPTTGAGTRLMFIPGLQGAFRSGRITGTEWDTVGLRSVAFGNNCISSATNTFASGNSSDATGNNSIAMGNTCVASAVSAVAVGRLCTSSGTECIAIGKSCTAGTASNALAIGNVSAATAANAISIGESCEATGISSLAVGANSKANGSPSLGIGNACEGTVAQSVAVGLQCKANGILSAAIGLYVRATAANSVSIGAGLNTANPMINAVADSMYISMGSVEPTLRLESQKCAVVGTTAFEPLSTLDVGGSVGYDYRDITGDGTTTTVLSTENELTFYIDVGTAGHTLALPAIAGIDRRIYNVKVIDPSGTGGGNLVSIDPNGTEQIEDYNAAIGGVLGAGVALTISRGTSITVQAHASDTAWWVL